MTPLPLRMQTSLGTVHALLPYTLAEVHAVAALAMQFHRTCACVPPLPNPSQPPHAPDTRTHFTRHDAPLRMTARTIPRPRVQIQASRSAGRGHGRGAVPCIRDVKSGTLRSGGHQGSVTSLIPELWAFIRIAIASSPSKKKKKRLEDGGTPSHAVCATILLNYTYCSCVFPIREEGRERRRRRGKKKKKRGGVCVGGVAAI